MSLPPTTQVLVVGGGPAGLVSAITLRKQGLQVVIVDALPTAGHGSRAPLIHARTLEVLDTVGLAQPLIRSGVQGTGIKLHGGLNMLMDVDIRLLEGQTQFPRILLIAQNQTVRILEEQLAEAGLKVLRNRKAVDMKCACKGGGVVVTFGDGSSITAEYVIGADGPRSAIRRFAGITFDDPHTGLGYDNGETPRSAMKILLADLQFKETLPPSVPLDAVSWHLNSQVLLCPLRTSSDVYDADVDEKQHLHWRVGFVVPTGVPPPPRHPDVEYLQHCMDQRKPWVSQTTVHSARDIGTYTVRSAVASTLYKTLGSGYVLLVGDAAHVHSPVGAQGMNLGLCDAVALGGAVRAHIDARAEDLPEEELELLLMKYSTSRRKRAVEVIEMTKRLTSVINSPPGWRRTLWKVILWVAGCFPAVRRLAAWRLSGLMHRDF